jgi:hypothetical protein
VVLKALTLAQHDIQRGALDSERRHRVRETLQGLLHNLSEHGAHLIAAEAAMLELPEDWKSEPVLCVAGHSDFDEWAGLLLVDLLRRQGLGGRVISNADAMPSNIHHLEDAGFKIVCVSYLEPANYTNARYLVRRLRKRFARCSPCSASGASPTTIRAISTRSKRPNATWSSPACARRWSASSRLQCANNSPPKHATNWWRSG